MGNDSSDLIMGLLRGTGFDRTVSDFAQQNAQTDAVRQQTQASQFDLASKQQTQAREQRYQADVQSYYAHPTREALGQLAVKYPDHADAFKNAYSAMDTAARQGMQTQYGSLYAAANNGRVDLVKSQLQQIKTAEQATGVDTSEVDDALTGLADPATTPATLKQIAGLSQMHLAAADPAKFADVFNALGKGQDGFTLSEGETRFNGDGSTVASVAPKPEKPDIRVIRNADGSESAVQFGGNAASAPAAGSVPQTKLSPRWTSAQLADTVPFGGTVTSGARSPARNAAVGGVPNSQHLAGTAIDAVFPKGVTTQQVKDYYASKGASVQVIHENAGDPHSTGDHFHIQGASPGAPPVTSQARFNDSGTKVLYTSKGNPGGASGAAPSGYRYKHDGTLEPIPGGPADSEKLDDDTVSTMAQQYLAGDKTVLQNLGRGAQGGAAVARVRQEIARQAKAAGMSGRDIAAQMADFTGVVASERATGTRTAQVELAATEAQKLAPLALAASDALPRDSWTPLARAQQSIRSGSNNVLLRRFVTANQGLVNTYARAVSPTGVPTVDSQNHAREMLNTAFDQTSYRAVVGQMMKEIQAARAAPRAVRDDLRQNVGGNYKPGVAPVRVNSPQQAMALPPGTVFVTPDARRKVR